ncbi:MAG: hypothetical protein EAX90_14955 [Candidatus Heimdallarchaeota archaeon]|nr:hypothetical protein [Candidatus Heimdallarchaeota archaeon]
MLVCKKCNSIVEEELTVCPFCGEILEHSRILSTFEQSSDNTEFNYATSQDAKNQVHSLHATAQDSDDQMVFQSQDLDDLELQEYQEQGIPLTMDKVSERNYFAWFALGIISVGIFFLIYLYLNLEDLERHSHYPNELHAKPISVNPSSILMLFLIAICFGFIPIFWYVYYKKYSSLYYHIKDQKYDTAPHKIIHPVFYMIPLILSHLTALVPTIVGFATSINIRDSFPGVFWSIFAVIIVLSILTAIMDYFWQRAFNIHIRLSMIKMGMMEQEV